MREACENPGILKMVRAGTMAFRMATKGETQLVALDAVEQIPHRRVSANQSKDYIACIGFGMASRWWG